MRLPCISVMILCSLVFSPVAAATVTQRAVGSGAGALHIRVEGSGWGNVDTQQIETVLFSVADEMLTGLPAKFAVPIVITHGDSNPIALYDRGPAGEYLVRLHASGDRWHLYVFEFAHEFCHLLSNFDQNIGENTRRRNQWFEESLCETASLFALERLASTWPQSASASGLPERAGKLRRFFDLLVAEEHRRLPPQIGAAGWLSDNEQGLRRDPYQREKNDLVANLLLPLFERHPNSWNALCYLNLDPADASAPLTEYVRHWYERAPLEHKAFIAGVISLLGRDVDRPSTATINPEAANQMATVSTVAALTGSRGH